LEPKHVWWLLASRWLLAMRSIFMSVGSERTDVIARRPKLAVLPCPIGIKVTVLHCVIDPNSRGRAICAQSRVVRTTGSNWKRLSSESERDGYLAAIAYAIDDQKRC